MINKDMTLLMSSIYIIFGCMNIQQIPTKIRASLTYSLRNNMTPYEIQEAVSAIIALRPTFKEKTPGRQGRLIDIKKRQDNRAFDQELAEIDRFYRTVGGGR
ncbi:hypothetical protein C4G53_RS23885 [Vibrio parahaemolyticus]|nr:hypothetical protein [Vibrio parahaemolyticus]EIA1590657.1 hypothetical protein [Vibrio parahaemolyticus]EIA1769768.1 hypothetical protein [Vibrio parahaemolyticus]EJG1086782.1 hypothetical protein [Vibrio parahaemolyticus]EJG1862037.1 hypothetical protein [Vibrio parahaemolyticus]